MSLDLTIFAVVETDVFDTNITHNISPMWHKAGVYEALYESEGKRPGDYIEAVRAGVADMKAKPDEYNALNASNGWGTYKDALPFLEEVLEAFCKYPDGRIMVSR